MQKENRWKEKFHKVVNTCQTEFKKTTSIGKKMLCASKATSEIKDHHEHIGRIVVQAMEENDLEWTHPKIEELRQKIDMTKQTLKDCEDEVHNIKGS